MSQLLLVEDEPVLGDTLQRSIRKIGHDCVWVKSLSEARSVLKRSSFDFWVLDRNLPDGDGIELLSEPDRNRTMVLVLSSKSSAEEKIEGLQAGADDYLQKPFSFQELSARLQALERRRPPSVGAASVAEGASTLWSLDSDTLKVLAPTGWVTLTPLEFKCLSYLIRHEGKIVSKDRLLREVWGFSLLPKTRTVDYLITQLRKRIEPEPESPRHLITIRGAGMKFTP